MEEARPIFIEYLRKANIDKKEVNDEELNNWFNNADLDGDGLLSNEEAAIFIDHYLIPNQKKKQGRFSEKYLKNSTTKMYDLKNPRQYFNTKHPVFGQIYCEFIINLLKYLEPIKFDFNKIIYDELEEVSSVYFFKNGIFDVGFDINGKKHYVLRYKNFVVDYSITDALQMNAGEIIGDYNVTYQKASRFIYKTRSVCEGYEIRRKNWDSILNANDFIGNALRKQINKRHIRMEYIMET
jgi:hypothetical protein